MKFQENLLTYSQGFTKIYSIGDDCDCRWGRTYNRVLPIGGEVPRHFFVLMVEFLSVVWYNNLDISKIGVDSNESI